MTATDNRYRAGIRALEAVAADRRILDEVLAERGRQDARWGQQDHPDGTGPDVVWAFTGPASYVADAAKRDTDVAAHEGGLTYRHIALEEFAEAVAEADPAKLRAELVQLAAVATAWVQAIDRRHRHA